MGEEGLGGVGLEDEAVGAVLGVPDRDDDALPVEGIGVHRPVEPEGAAEALRGVGPAVAEVGLLDRIAGELSRGRELDLLERRAGQGGGAERPQPEVGAEAVARHVEVVEGLDADADRAHGRRRGGRAGEEAEDQGEESEERGPGAADVAGCRHVVCPSLLLLPRYTRHGGRGEE